ncbi:MAG: S41 family peptidase [Rikenellaceae bacterium]
MIKNFFLTLLLLVPLFSYSQGVVQNKRLGPSQKALSQGEKLAGLISLLDMVYLEDIDAEKLTDAAINKVLSELDPHSSYLTKEEMKLSTEMFSGNFEGIGIEFNVINDTLIVVNTIKGGPSEKVGLHSGDRIIKVDTTNVIGISKTDVHKYLRGKKGSIVKLTVVRKAVDGTLDFTIVRDKIPIVSMDAAYLIDPTTAYIKLNRFMATTTDEFTQALDSLKKSSGDKVNGVILDLRGNGGGQLDQAISLSSNLLPEKSLVLYTEGKKVSRSNIYAYPNGAYTTGALVVLVDEESASASEIVTGAVQDWDRGTVVGRSTFGKGLVQRQFPLRDSSALQITIARYHTPSGRFIQRPYVLGKQDDYYANYIKRYISNEAAHADSIFKDVPDSLKYKTLIKGRTVYGGGGINPDVFVPSDTTLNSKYWGQVIGKGLIGDYVANYYDINRNYLNKKYPKFEKFQNNFIITDQMYNDLKLLADKNKIKDDKNEADKLKSYVLLQIKALIAQKLWDTSHYFMIVNSDPSNKMIQTALNEIKKIEKQ